MDAANKILFRIVHFNYYLVALVTSKVFRTQVVKAKKGKGSFNRKEKYKGRESNLIAA
ncbi:MULTISPECIES: alternative ribosome rescue factor ArfA [unclassified Pseudoalteromonas]|uniref:alternative ribosome rescue factor ArfA n=1 Tax=unclassified Pseudoalteromonas TaxID=194690 RepID=UPI001E448FD4|nr:MULTISPECIES: alternative ribosome rescue factor ArfA [unclassified Pseudoalteromonas]